MTITRPAPRTAPELRADPDQPVSLARLGRIGYRDAADLQHGLVAARRASTGPDALLLLEHPPVYTLGKRAERDHVLLPPDELARRGIEVVEVDRGGDVTYHGPGQLVGYPILKLAGLRSVVDYVRALESVLIHALGRLGVDATRVPEYTGVWVEGAKIAAIGVRVASGGITSHGFALNVDPDLHDFAGIVPCGITDRGVCSLASLGVTDGVETVTDVVAESFAEVFAATLLDTPPDRLLPVDGSWLSPTPTTDEGFVGA
ncbi:MAG: lipoyl(octanoyl) transferase LipB [Nitriliruptoraceae bacterium]